MAGVLLHSALCANSIDITKFTCVSGQFSTLRTLYIPNALPYVAVHSLTFTCTTSIAVRVWVGVIGCECGCDVGVSVGVIG